MGKKGYRCYIWVAGIHDQYLIDNYATMSNADLGKGLGLLNKKHKINDKDTTPRTADAVRKRLNHLNLRRPKKSQKPKEPKQNVSFFTAIKKGMQKRILKGEGIKHGEKFAQKMGKEKRWAENVMGVKPKAQITTAAKPEKNMTWITVDERGTRMQVPKGEEEKWIKIYAAKQLTGVETTPITKKK